MATLHSYPFGAPCCFELATTDCAAAVRFYSALLGWTPHHVESGHGVYTLLKLEGRDAAACCELSPAQRNLGVPPHWGVYFQVADVTAGAARAQELGGSVVLGPLDIDDRGRLVVLKDPEGVVFRLWQTRKAGAPGVVHEDNAMGWVELATRDTARAAAFYSQLLGWQVREHEHPVAGSYRLCSIDGQDWAGMLPMSAQWGDVPAHWSLYFRVSSCDAAVESLKALGGSVVAGPFNAPGVGRIAVVRDPQGAAFYLVRFDLPAVA